MRNRIRFVHVSYWVCVIFEVLAVIPMFSPALFSKILGVPNFNPGPDYRYAMAVAAVFTLGWIALLIWADRKPIERKGVLLLTIPVMAGNAICGMYAVSSGFIAAGTMIPSWITQSIVIVLFGFAYYLASREPAPAEQGRIEFT